MSHSLTFLRRFLDKRRRATKPFDISDPDDRDRLSVAEQPSRHAYSWPEVGDEKSLSARRWSRTRRGAGWRPGSCATVPVEPAGGGGSLVYRARRRMDVPDQPVGIDIIRPLHRPRAHPWDYADLFHSRV